MKFCALLILSLIFCMQLAPGIPVSKRRPQPGTLPEWGFNWYGNLTFGRNTSINPYFYGTYLSETKTAEPGI